MKTIFSAAAFGLLAFAAASSPALADGDGGAAQREFYSVLRGDYGSASDRQSANVANAEHRRTVAATGRVAPHGSGVAGKVLQQSGDAGVKMQDRMPVSLGHNGENSPNRLHYPMSGDPYGNWTGNDNEG